MAVRWQTAGPMQTLAPSDTYRLNIAIVKITGILEKQDV